MAIPRTPHVHIPPVNGLAENHKDYQPMTINEALTQSRYPPSPTPVDSKSETIAVMPVKRTRMKHTIRELTIEECKQLEPIFHAQGVELPDPATSTIIGAIDEMGKVTENFIVGQLRLHTEPLVLQPGCEHLFRPLAKALYDKIATSVGTVDVYLFAPDGKVAQMAEVMGMDREPWAVYSTRVYGNAPVGMSAPSQLEDSKLELVPLDDTDIAFDRAMRGADVMANLDAMSTASKCPTCGFRAQNCVC